MATGNTNKIVLTASIQDQGLGAGLKALAGEVERLQKQYNSLKISLGQATTAEEAQKRATEAAKKAAEDETLALRAKISALKGNTAEETKYTKELQNREKATLAAATGDEKLAAEMIKLRNELDKLTKEQIEHNKKLGETEKGLDSQRAASSKLGLAMAGMGVAITGAMGLATKAAINFDYEMAKVSTVADTNEEGMKELRKAILGLPPVFGDATTMAHGLYVMLQAGVTDPKEALEALASTAKFAKGNIADLGQSVDLATSIMAAYGLESKDLDRVLDILTGTIQDGKIEVNQFVGSLGLVIPTAASLGVELDEVGAALVVMTRQGIQTDHAIVSLNQVLLTFLDPSEDAKKLAGQLGVELSKAALESKGLGGAVGDLAEKIASMNDKELRDQAIAVFFGNVRSLRGAMALTGQQAGFFEKELFKLKTETGLTDNAFIKITGSSKELAGEAWSNLTNLAIQIGSVVLPALNSIISPLNDFISSMRDLPEPIQEVIAWMGLGTGATLGLAGVALLLIPKIYETKVALEAMGIGAGVLNTVFGGLNATMLANPIILVGATLILLESQFKLVSGAVWGLYQFVQLLWEGLRDSLGPIVTSVGEALGGFFGKVKDLIFGVPILGGAIDYVGGTWDQWNEAVKKTTPNIETSIKNVRTGTTEDLRHALAVTAMNTALKGMSSQMSTTATAIELGTFKVIGQGEEYNVLTGKLEKTKTAHTELTSEQVKQMVAAQLRIAQLKLQIAEENGSEKAIAAARAEVERLTVAHLVGAGGSKALSSEEAKLTTQLDALKESKKRAREEAEKTNAVTVLEIAIRQGFGELYDKEGKDIEDLYIKKKEEIENFALKDGATQVQIMGLRSLLEATYHLASEAAAKKHFDAINTALEAANTKYVNLDGDKLAAILFNAGLEAGAKEKQITDLLTNTQKAADDIIAIFSKAKNDRIGIGDDELAALLGQLNQHKSNVDLNIDEIIKALGAAGTTDIELNRETLKTIADDETQTTQARITKIGEYVAAVGKNAEAVRAIEEELSSHNIETNENEWSKKVQAEYDYYDKVKLLIGNLTVDEETKSRLFEELAGKTNGNILKIDEDYATAHGGVLDKLKAAWESLKTDTISKVDATYQFFSETLTAAANFFKEAFVAIITLDVDRLVKAFGDFALSILKALEDLAAQLIAKKVFEWLTTLWDWIRGAGEEADKTKQKIEDMGGSSGPIYGLVTVVGSLVGTWALLNFQIATSNELLSRTPASGGIMNMLNNVLGAASGSGGGGFGGIMDKLGSVGKMLSKIPGLSAIGVPLMGAGLGFGAGKLLGNLFGMSARGSNIMGGIGGGGIGGGLGAMALASALGLTLGSLGVGIAAILGGAGGGFLGSMFGKQPPHKKIRIKSDFEGITRDAQGRFTPGNIDFYASSYKEISRKEANAYADRIEREVTGAVGGWVDIFNRFPEQIYDTLMPEIETANAELAHQFERLRFSTRDDLSTEINRFVRSSSRRVAREYVEPFKAGLDEVFSEFMSAEDIEKIGATFDTLFKSLTSSNTKFKLLPDTIDAILDFIDQMSINRELLNPADMATMTKNLGDTFEEINSIIASGGSWKDRLSGINASLAEFQQYVQAVFDFLGEQQAIIDADVLSDFAVALADLNAKYEEGKKTADALGLTHEKLNQAYGIQLMGLTDLKAMQEEIAARTTPEMVLAMNGLMDWGAGMREQIDTLFGAATEGTITSDNLWEFIEAAKGMKDIQMIDLKDKFVTPFSDFIAEIDAMMGEPVDNLVDFNTRLGEIHTEEGEGKLAAAQGAIDAINAWFISLGDFASISADAAQEIQRLEEVPQSLSEIQGRFNSLAEQLSESALEAQYGILEEMSQALREAEVAAQETTAQREALEERIAEIKDNTIPALQGFLDSLIETSPWDRFKEAFDGIDTAADKADAARDALSALGEWTKSLGDFAGIAAKAGEHFGGGEQGTFAESISMATTLMDQLGSTSLEERAAKMEEISSLLSQAEGFLGGKDALEEILDFSHAAAEAGKEIERLSPEILRTLPEIQNAFGELSGQVSDAALGLRMGILEEMSQALQEAEVAAQETTAQREALEERIAEIKDNTIPALQNFLDSMDDVLGQMFGIPTNFLDDFDTALGAIATSSNKLDAAHDAVEALKNWFNNLGDFAGIADKAAQKVASFNVPTESSMMGEIAKLSGMPITDQVSMISAIQKMIDSAQNAPIESQGKLFEDIEKALDLAEQLQNMRNQQEIERLPDEIKSNKGIIDSISKRGIDELIELWENLEEAARDADIAAREEASNKMEEVRSAIEAEKIALQESLNQLNQIELPALIAAEAANAQFLLDGWQLIQAEATSAQAEANGQRDLLLEEIRLQGETDSLAIQELWQRLQGEALAADTEAQGIVSTQTEAIKTAIENEKILLEAQLITMNAELVEAQAAEAANAQFLLDGWKLIQDEATSAQEEADGLLHGMMTQVRDAVNAEREALVATLETLNRDLTDLMFKYFIAPIETPLVSAQHGMDYVPADDFPIRAHRGEAVITARGNEALGEILTEIRRGGIGQSLTVVIQPAPIYLDGKQVSEAVFKVIRTEGESGRPIVPGKAVYQR